MLKDATESLFSVTGKIGDLIRSGKANSLAEFTASAHNVPIYMVDNDCEAMPEIENILGGILNLNAAILLMAANMSVNIGNIEVNSQLERLNSRRSPLNAGSNMASRLFKMESYANGLPDPRKAPSTLKMESNNTNVITGSAAGMARGQVDRIQGSSKLSLGKVVEFEWESEGHRGTVVSLLRPAILSTNSESMINILSIGTNNYTFKESLHGILSGSRDFWRDGVMAQDVLRENRKQRINDKTGYFRQAQARYRSNKIAGLVSLNPSIANFTSAFVISAETARNLEVRSGINLEDFKSRQAMFANSLSMILCVVDRSWKNCKIYIHSIDGVSKVSFSQMEGVGKDKNGDVKEMLNALLLNDAPRF